MNKLISSLVKTAVVYAATLAVTNLNAQTSSSSPKVESVEIFTITSVPAENGSYTISPKIPDDGAGHAFFDWKPDAATRATFARYGVPYAAQMQAFFNSIFYND
jgi:hypothetical protein